VGDCAKLRASESVAPFTDDGVLRGRVPFRDYRTGVLSLRTPGRKAAGTQNRRCGSWDLKLKWS
jgi:hypothetical protein